MMASIVESRNLIWNWTCLACKSKGVPSRVHGPSLDNMITRAVLHQDKKKCGGAIALECENGRVVMADDAVIRLKRYSDAYNYLDPWLEMYMTNLSEEERA